MNDRTKKQQLPASTRHFTSSTSGEWQKLHSKSFLSLKHFALWHILVTKSKR